MYSVKMKYVDVDSINNQRDFTCESVEIYDNRYIFQNIIMKDFIIDYMEVINEDIICLNIK